MISKLSIISGGLALLMVSITQASPLQAFRDTRLSTHIYDAKVVLSGESDESQALPIAVKIYERVRYLRSFFGESAWSQVQTEVVSTLTELESYSASKGATHASSEIGRMAANLERSKSDVRGSRQ